MPGVETVIIVLGKDGKNLGINVLRRCVEKYDIQWSLYQLLLSSSMV